MTVDDGPKVRIVQAVSLEDRIVLNAVMNVVDRHLKVRFIRTTSASIKTGERMTFYSISLKI